jgi:hypothetical protein
LTDYKRSVIIITKMKYPKTVQKQVKEIVEFCGIVNLSEIEYIRRSVYIAYLNGKADGIHTAAEQLNTK